MSYSCFRSLRDVQNDKLIAPDGRSIKDRISSLVERTAADIKLCSNVCNAFAKKRLLAKVIKGPIWDGKLLGWVALFSKRREEFKLELSIHTSQGVDKANAKLDDIGEKSVCIKFKFSLTAVAKITAQDERYDSHVSTIGQPRTEKSHRAGGCNRRCKSPPEQ